MRSLRPLHRASVLSTLVVAVVASLMASLSPATASQSPRLSSQAVTGALEVTGSVKQVFVTNVAGGAKVALVNPSGERIRVQRANDLGGVVFYHVRPDSGYRVRVLPDGPLSASVTVHSERSAPWDPEIYNQSIPDQGYTYLTTRDGTQLAINVHPPTQPAGLGTPNVVVPAGPDYAEPYPTLIEYSGYGYADPAGPHSSIAAVANAMGFAVVDVNMRGTGCSGGAFNFFEPLQGLDGYDVIETIARQPWVLNHKVGMMGISYGGISQLFTAETHPPSLAAISPLSVIDATATTLYPGGILNTGFAVAWAAERQHDAMPASEDGGQRWAYDQIQSGDTTCEANQVLHGEAEDLMAKIRRNAHYRPKVADPLDPVTFVHKIHVPVFMACQWQDEQTGGHCPTLAEHMTGTHRKWFTFTNGSHIDSLDPETFNRWYDFLMLYVARRPPAMNSAVINAAAPAIYQLAMGVPSEDFITLPPDPIQQQPSYNDALSAFEQLPAIRVLFDNGAGSDPFGNFTAGNPYPGYEASFPEFPIPGTEARRWFLGPDGAMADSPSDAKSITQYTSDASALALTNYGSNTGGGGLWGTASQWDWQWQPNPEGTAVAYLSSPLEEDTTVVGAGAVHLWVRSSTPDVDLQVTVSEVDPNGNETFVQNGYLRASERKLDTRAHTIMASPSTLLEPVPSFRKSDAEPMPDDEFVKVVVPLYYQGHTYRAGSQIRITVAAPNGAQPVWSFGVTEPAGTATVSILASKNRPSSLVLPVVPGVDVPTDFPDCGSLRNQPCRAYTAFESNAVRK